MIMDIKDQCNCDLFLMVDPSGIYDPIFYPFFFLNIFKKIKNMLICVIFCIFSVISKEFIFQISFQCV